MKSRRCRIAKQRPHKSTCSEGRLDALPRNTHDVPVAHVQYAAAVNRTLLQRHRKRLTRDIKNTLDSDSDCSDGCVFQRHRITGGAFVRRVLPARWNGQTCRSGLRAASGVRSGTRRRRGSLGRSDVVVGCPAVGFIVLLIPPISRGPMQACTPLACTSACICLHLRTSWLTFSDT